MDNWLRRIRGAIGMGLTWAAAWFGAGIALLLVVGVDAADVPFPIGCSWLNRVPLVIHSSAMYTGSMYPQLPSRRPETRPA